MSDAQHINSPKPKSWELTPGVGRKRNKLLRARTLFILAAVGYAFAWLNGDSILSDAIGTFALVCLLLSIVAFVRERRQARQGS